MREKQMMNNVKYEFIVNGSDARPIKVSLRTLRLGGENHL